MRKPPAAPADPTPSPLDDTTLAVTEEQVAIGRRTVDSGRPVRVRKQVHENPVRVEVPVAHERVDVERVPVGRVVDVPPAVRQDGDVTVVPVIEERVVTRKELVLVEEIRLIRRRAQSQALKDVTLRREHVVVERFDPDTGEWLPEGS